MLQKNFHNAFLRGLEKAVVKVKAPGKKQSVEATLPPYDFKKMTESDIKILKPNYDCRKWFRTNYPGENLKYFLEHIEVW